MKSFTGLVTTLSVTLRKVTILPNILPVVNYFLNVLLSFLERWFLFKPHVVKHTVCYFIAPFEKKKGILLNLI